MIRILQVVTHMNRGGLETMIMNYYRHMERSKVQFDFLVHRDAQAAYDDEIESLGGIIHRLPMLNPFSKSYLDTLDSFFKQHPEYKVIHVHQDCMSSVILKAAKKNNIQVRIAHSHSSSQDKNLKYLIKLYFKRSIPKYATDLFACGKEAGDWMFNGAPYQVLSNAIHSEGYTYNNQIKKTKRSELGFQNNELVIGHVGRFCYPKNHTFLIDVFSSILKKRNAKLLLVGDGELRKEIEEKVHSLGLDDSVIMTGIRSDVAALMQAMDVFVFPSNYEGLPVTMVEAQASGLPCLISDKVPIECKMTDNVEQFSLSHTADEWAEKILQMVNGFVRRDTSADIKAAGFDIVENANMLQEFYIERYNSAE